MNFGTRFMTVMEAIYNKPKAKIKLNNARSGFILINQGTHQGCPLSPLLFALFIEPLANMIHNSLDISDIRYAQREIKTFLFADDVIVYMSSLKQSLTALERILSNFHKASGLTLNKTKSEIYPVFLQQTDQVELKSLTSYHWISSSWKYLEVVIPVNMANLYKANFTNFLRTLTQSLASLT